MSKDIDVKDMLETVNGVKAAKEMPISVSLILDDSANAALLGYVRNAFASAAVQARITIGYIDSSLVAQGSGDDLAVIVAGKSEKVGECAQQISDGGVPVMIVTDDPRTVVNIASASGHPLPLADVIAPVAPMDSNTVKALKSLLPRCLKRPKAMKNDGIPETAVELTDEAFELLDERMGRWIIAACPDKILAMALAFSFVRKPMCDDIINSTSLENGIAGLVEFVPSADYPVMSANQCRMLLEIAAAFGEDVSKERVKEIVAVLAGGLACRNVARKIVGVIPVVGWVVKGTIGYGGSFAIGKAAVEYFEAGGGVAGFSMTAVKAQDVAIKAVKKALSSEIVSSLASSLKQRATSGDEKEKTAS